MIKPEQVLDDVVEAARVAWLRSDVSAKEDWCAAIAAALNAWPGMHHYEPNAEPYYGKHLILPLPPPPAGETNEV